MTKTYPKSRLVAAFLITKLLKSQIAQNKERKKNLMAMMTPYQREIKKKTVQQSQKQKQSRYKCRQKMSKKKVW